MENNIIKFNTYKLERGGLLYDMYDQFNARVGDQGTPLVIQWLQGLTDTEVDLQAKELHFYATGQVGKYLEKLKDGTGYQMSADASQVEYEDRNAAGTMDHGITKVKFPKQFFPQEGIFYGYFGLKDAQGNTYTSINVWFRVLGGVPIMGAAIPYFSTRFDELMETFKGRAADALAELRQEYLDEVKKNEDMSAETRAALEKLAASVGAIQAQIDAGNVISRQQFDTEISSIKAKQDNVSAQIKDQLSRMQIKVESYKTLDDLKKAYPTGADGLFMITSENHWYYWDKTAWIDGGSYAGAKFDFSSVSGGYYNLLEGTSAETKDFHGTQWQANTTATNSDKLVLTPGQTYTYALNASGQNGIVYLEVLQYDADGKRLKQDTVDASNGKRTVLTFTVLANTARTQVDFVFKNIPGTYNVNVAKETLLAGSIDHGWRKSLNDYSLPEAIQLIANLSTDKMVDQLSDISNGVNLLRDTSATPQTFALNGWDMVSTASNAWQLDNLQAGQVYTYSAKIEGTGGDHPVALKARSLDGKTYFRTEAITSDGTYSLTFTMPSNAGVMTTSVGAFSEFNKPYNIQISEEQLQHGAYRTPYYGILSNYTLQGIATALRHSSEIDYGSIETLVPYFNLLRGTSNQQQTFIGKGWQRFSTATNATTLHLTKDKKYTYVANVEPSKGSGSVQVFFYDDNGNQISFVRSSYSVSKRRMSLTFTVPDNAVTTQVACVFGESDADNNVMSVDSEALFIGDNALSYCKAVEECNQGEILQRIAVASQLGQSDIQQSMPYFNLLSNTSNAEQRFTSQDAWSQFTTASSNTLSLNPNGKYTYQAQINVNKGTASLQAFFYDDNGDQISLVRNDYIDGNFKRGLTFTVPANAASTKVAIVCGSGSNDGYDISVSEEALFVGDNMYDYCKSIDECSDGEVIQQIAKYSAKNVDEINERYPYFNLLQGTSTKEQTFVGTGWSYWSTASNSTLSLKPAATYTYAADVEATKGTASVQAIFYDKDGNRLSFQKSSYMTGPARMVVTFTVPDNAVTTQVACVFGEGQDQDYTMKVKNESLYRYNHDLGWNPGALAMSNAEILDTILSHTQISSSNNTGSISKLPVLTVNGDYSGLLASNKRSTLPFTLSRDGNTMSGYVSMEWQGNSSKDLPKHGFKTKFFKDEQEDKKLKFKPTPTFYKSSSFHLKGYYTNYYGINDAACAEIYSRFIANDELAPVQLQQANHYGTIQSMPTLLYFGDQFYGLMELNTKSGSDLWNMDKDNPDEIALEANTNDDFGQFVKIGGELKKDSNFEVQSDNETNAKAALDKLQKALVVTDDATFKQNVANMFDENSIADAIIFNYIVNNSDGWNGKNQCYLTYDGGDHWYWMAYDFDSSLGSSWKPGTIYADDRDYFTDPDQFHNQALRRWLNLNPDKLLNRFNELEAYGVLNIADLQSILRTKINTIGEIALEQEHDRWSGNPTYQTDELNIDHLCYMIAYRKRLLKQKIEAMQKK